MTTATEHLYIETDEEILGGEPIIKGTRTPVRAVVETWRMGVAAEEITHHLPHLTQAQVFDALSYYSDHQAEINHYIERNRIPDELIDLRVRNM
ncbi:MAG: hypothetical protein QOC96_2766 [Acidobacteriota bacterium]|jgi:uncharacterized protein (DUF433 family)|nr:hypothetical protein [Acidobacteriota bacterium]